MMMRFSISLLLLCSLSACGREMMPKSRAQAHAAWSNPLIREAIESDPEYTPSDRERLHNSQDTYLEYIYKDEANDGE